MIDLDAYLRRIGLSGRLEPSLASLETLHLAHLTAIPFENVDVRLGRPIRLDAESLQAKLVERRRGGYCFEQNTLFASALRALGFSVNTLEARVRHRGATEILPRTHMTLGVHVEGRDYLADVGFGGTGPLLPVPLDGTNEEQADGRYWIERGDGGEHVLQQAGSDGQHEQYAFKLDPVFPIDFEVANHYTSTYPGSQFVKTLTVQRSELGGRYILRGRTYTVRTGGNEHVREVTEEELPGLLREGFGLDVSDEEARLALGVD